MRPSISDFIGARWSANEETFLTWSGRADLGHVLYHWDSQNGNLLAEMRHDAWIRDATWNDDESLIVSYQPFNVRIWDSQTHRQIAAFDHGNVEVTGARLMIEDAYLLSWTAAFPLCSTECRSAVWLWNLEDQTLVSSWVLGNGIDLPVAVNPSRNAFAAPDEQTGIMRSWYIDRRFVWLPPNRGSRPGYDTEIIEQPVRDIEFDHIEWAANSDHRFLTVSDDAVVWDTTQSAGMPLSQPGATSFQFDDVSERMLIYYRGRPTIINDGAWYTNLNSSAVVLDAQTGQEILSLPSGSYIASMNSDASRIATWGEGLLSVWEIDPSTDQSTSDPNQSIAQLTTKVTFETDVTQLIWNPQSSHFLTLHNTTNPREINDFKDDLYVWDASTGENTLHIESMYEIREALWNHDGSQILTVHSQWETDDNVRIWNASTGQLVSTLRGLDGSSGVAWSPDDNRIAACCTADDKIAVWDVNNSTLLSSIDYARSLSKVLWWDDSRQLVLYGDRTVVFWDIIAGETTLQLTHRDAVNHVEWSGDDTKVFTTTNNHAYIWDVTSGELIWDLPIVRPFSNVAWSSNGDYLITNSSDRNTIIRWPTDIDYYIEAARERIGFPQVAFESASDTNLDELTTEPTVVGPLSATNLPEFDTAATTPTTPRATSVGTATVDAGGPVNLRSGPGTEYPRVGTVEPDTEVGVVASQANWFYLIVDDTTYAWIRSDFLNNVSTSSTIPSASDLGITICSPLELEFPEVWATRYWELGCASSPTSYVPGTSQAFENGLMIWRGDTRQIYAISDDGRWTHVPDRWSEGDALDCNGPFIQRGFGKAYCDHPPIQEVLGSALETEAPGSTLSYQRYENGLIIYTQSTGPLILLDENRFEP
ncbi:MAG: SH3 domain-containing protein [Anaerolineae bacterium]|nr:SH3 domain-containing protein [Anaerolineae bacterium]